MAPDNTHFYISQHIDTIIKKLTQSVFSRKGFMLLCGEIGLGKTTISRRIIDILEEHEVETCLVLQSFYQGNDLLKEIIRDFGLSTEEVRNDLSTLMELLNTFLIKKNNAGINCAILIDDAQNLTVESLELIRLISNLEADREKLVQIILVGQPELLEKLNRHELRQLKSRVTINQEPIPLHPSEVGNYIQFKLNRAGDPGKIHVSEEVVKVLFRLTRGNIRRINILMDQALQYASKEKTFTIITAHIKRANKELALTLYGHHKSVINTWITLLLILVAIGMTVGTGLFYFMQDKNTGEKIVMATAEDILVRSIQDNQTRALMPNQSDKNPHQSEKSTDMSNKTAWETSDQSPNSLPSQTDLKKKKKTQIELMAEKSIQGFLTSYGLSTFTGDFQSALDSQQFKTIKKHIFDETGFQLIRLNNIPESIMNKYDILSRLDSNAQTPEYYLFWKPWLNVANFYSGFKGQEITELQILLKKMDLYHGNIDGIVGQIILKSVKEFQRKYYLPVTGFPDPETVFLLAHSD